MLADRPPADFSSSLLISCWTTNVVDSPSLDCTRYRLLALPETIVTAYPFLTCRIPSAFQFCRGCPCVRFSMNSVKRTRDVLVNFTGYGLRVSSVKRHTRVHTDIDVRDRFECSKFHGTCCTQTESEKRLNPSLVAMAASLHVSACARALSQVYNFRGSSSRRRK